MHSLVAALGISSLLVLAGVSLSCLAPHDGSLASASPTDDHAAMPARSGHGHAAGAHEWSGGKGTIPDLASALTNLERRSRIVIANDSQFNPANGVRSGSGTFDDPFVISGWFVDQVLIADTSLAFEIKENYVSDILILDWTGQGGYVHHNHLADMRTNRNVARTGDPTAAVFENNLILNVEELRHFDGEVRKNTIGQEGALNLLDSGVVLNIAGLNGAGIHDNVIFGGVDMKIHGHHHSDKPGAHSHNHGAADAQQGEDHTEDHQVRYVDFQFYRNRIVDDKFGMRYNDLAHAGDDRQATSEQEPALEMPHEHHTRIALHDNVIEGATLRIVVVNAQDERHVGREEATLLIYNNTIRKPLAGDGLVVQDVKNALVQIHHNKVERSDLQLSGTSAILLARFQNSTVEVSQNKLGDYRYGVRAAEFDTLTRWSVEGNDAPGAEYAVYWDASVPNPPEGMEGDAAHEGHDHGSGLADAMRAIAARTGSARRA